MKIAIDARAWGWTGVGRYIRELVREYAGIESPHTFVLLVSQENRAEIAALPWVADTEKFALHAIDGSYYSWQEQVVLPFQLVSVKADLFHFPHFNVPMFFNRPYVVTIHDTTRFYFPGQRRQGLLNQLAYEHIFSHATRSAKAVITVSKHTAQESQSLRVMSRPPYVIYEGVGEEFYTAPSQLNRSKVRALIDIKDPFLLYIGVWMSHKNLPRLLAAFKEVRTRRPDLKLVMTGKPVPAYIQMSEIARTLGVADSIVFPGFVPHELLPALHAEAEGLVFPSLYEGFGLPALEAAAMGTPVIASNVSSLPEIMGKAAQYVNPEDEADIARGITRILNEEGFKNSLIAAGREQAKKFSWRACAEQTLDVYNNAL